MAQSARSKGGNTRSWVKIAYRIKQRDGWTCQYCGSDVIADMTVDHIIPISKGGSDDESNLCCACKKCNYSKNNKTSVFFSTARTPLTLPFLISPLNESKSHD